MAQMERKNKIGSNSGDRRQNRTILGRTLFLMGVFGVMAFGAPAVEAVADPDRGSRVL